MKRTNDDGTPRDRIAPTYGTARSRREMRQREAAARQAKHDAAMAANKEKA
jgi:hypothetical protein